MMASLMAGLAFSNASLGLVHAMAHSLGGAFGLPHGECNALLLERAVNFNYPEAAHKYNQLAGAMGLDMQRYPAEERAAVLAAGISSLRIQLGISTRLADMGVSLRDIPRLAGYALDDPCLATNPRLAALEDIEAIFKEIY